MPENDDSASELRGDPAPQPEDGTQDHRHYRRASPSSHEAPVNDPRLTRLLNWFYGVASLLVGSGIVWLVSVADSTARKVDVLLSRPMPVSMEQYKSDQAQIQRQIDELKSKHHD